MVRRLVSVCAAVACVLPVLGEAHGAELTDVVDAFDYANDNPFDFHLEPTFRQEFERGRITREAGCDPAVDPTRCDEVSTVFNRELDYRRSQTALDLDFQFGLYHDLEFHIGLPIVIHDRRELEYADGVTPQLSSIDPTDERVAADLDSGVGDPFGEYFGTYRYFDVPDDGRKRSGVGDVLIGLAWSPWNDRRNPNAANLTLRFDYVAPTGKPARGTNSGVGRGVHEIRLGIDASRRFVRFVEPYFGFHFTVPVAASGGLFEANGNTVNTAPGSRFDTTAGVEVIMADNEDRGQVYTFDLGFDFGYVLEGRDYGPMFDALASSPCNGLTPAEAGYGGDGPDGNAYRPDDDIDPNDAACAWVTQQPGNAEFRTDVPLANSPYGHDGITDIEGHGIIGGHTAFNLQFSPYVKFSIGTFVHYTTPHFLTAADAGRDRDEDNTVQLDPTPEDGEAERNPNYNLTMDAVGRRFRIENMLNIGWNARLAFQF